MASSVSPAALVDRYVADDVASIRQQIAELLETGLPDVQRSRQADRYLQRLAELDAEPQIDPATVRRLFPRRSPMSAYSLRGLHWFQALAAEAVEVSACRLH